MVTSARLRCNNARSVIISQTGFFITLQGYLDEKQSTLCKHNNAFGVRKGDYGGQHAKDCIDIRSSDSYSSKQSIQLIWIVKRM